MSEHRQVSRCARCVAPAEHDHHPTGRFDGAYLDPGLVVALCGLCHQEEHAVRRVLDLEGRRQRHPLTGFEVAELALRRIAVTLVRLDAMPAWVRQLGVVLVRLADLLASGVAALDQHQPGWRELPAAITKGA